ncbi:hypothetical protein ACFOY5_08875 [Massilia aurea]|uniref:hypothetical protein n=1 Tax=Massilia aurea TaxID=373040 RepID=UPI002163B169|nr:hypothetical protein [Massilia aurea]MCS0709857.1 hypothetical protein [Massilia aurea]
MLDGKLLELLTVAKYLIAQIAVNGNNAEATPEDLINTRLPFTLPVTLGELIGYVEKEIEDIHFEIKRLIGKEYWDSIIKAYDDTLTDYMSRKYDRTPRPR